MENSDCVSPAQQLECQFVIKRHIVNIKIWIALPANHFDSIGNDVKVSQAQEVHLEKPKFFHCMHFILRHNRRFVRLEVSHRLALNRQVLREFLGRNHHSCSMNTIGTLQAFQTSRNINHLGCNIVNCNEVTQSLCIAIAICELVVEFKTRSQRCVAALVERRHQLGNSVSDCVFVTQYTGRIAHSITRLNGGERNDLGHMVATVLLCRVANHVISIARVEVHVDIWHAYARWVEEPFKQKVVLQWVELCNAQAIRHRTSGSRTTTRTNTNAFIFRVLDEVPHNEEVRAKAHLLDDTKFEGNTFNNIGGKVLTPAHFRAFPCEVFQILLVIRELFRNRENGQMVRSQFNVNV